MQVDNLIVFDQVKRKIWAIAYADLRDGVDLSRRINKLAIAWEHW
jgi:anthranilate synthase component 1